MAVKYTHVMKQETKYPKGYVKIEEVKAWHYTKLIVKAGSKPKDHWILSLNSSRHSYINKCHHHITIKTPLAHSEPQNYFSSVTVGNAEFEKKFENIFKKVFTSYDEGYIINISNQTRRFYK